MEYKNSFVLNKAHFSECFDESARLNESLSGKKRKARYIFMAILTIVGFFIITFIDQDKLFGFFFIGLAFLEFFSFKYKKSWWLTRQMWSKNAGNTITQTFNEESIEIDSLNIKLKIDWNEIDHVDETLLGYTLWLNNKNHYISKLCLLPEMDTLFQSKVKIIKHCFAS